MDFPDFFAGDIEPKADGTGSLHAKLEQRFGSSLSQQLAVLRIIRACLDEIAPTHWQGRVHVVGYRDGCIHLRVGSAAEAAAMRVQLPGLVAPLKSRCKVLRSLRHIKVRFHPFYAPSKAREETASTPAPLSEDVRVLMRETAEKLHTPALKQALLSWANKTD